MDHIRAILSKSLDDSIALFFAAPKWSVAVAALVWIGGVGWNSVANWKGWPVMVASFTGWSWTILWPLAVFLAIFLFHFVCLTPKRMIADAEQNATDEADRADRIEKDLKSQIANREA